MKPLALAAIFAAATAAPALADTVTVYVFSYDYSQVNPNPPYPDPLPPDDPIIHVGDTVIFRRLNGTHDVRSTPGSVEPFSSPILTAGAPTYSHTYTHVGRHWFYCTFHGFANEDGSAGGMSGYVDVIAVPPPCTADMGAAGGAPGQDGVLNNNDFIAFINYFFAANTHADLGKTGGLPGSDGLYDNNDFIAFINLFFAGC
ncbi:MAG: GC-type dockerin domain-anchored protein [Phycisphaerales bacterium]